VLAQGVVLKHPQENLLSIVVNFADACRVDIVRLSMTNTSVAAREALLNMVWLVGHPSSFRQQMPALS